MVNRRTFNKPLGICQLTWFQAPNSTRVLVQFTLWGKQLVAILFLCWNVKHLIVFHQAGEVSAATLSCVSDGFMLNLGAVLLQLCQPFCTSPDDIKSLKIDPTYGAVLVSVKPHQFYILETNSKEECVRNVYMFRWNQCMDSSHKNKVLTLDNKKFRWNSSMNYINIFFNSADRDQRP